MRLRHRITLAACAALLTHSCFAAAGPAEDEARRRFSRGISLYDSRDFGGALAEFRRADQLAPSSVVRFNIALSYAALNRPVLARASLDELLLMPNVPAPERTRAERMRRQMDERIGKLTVVANVDDARVEVDGFDAGTTPLPSPVDVAAGARVVTVHARGYLPARREVTIASGEHASVNVTLTPTDAKLARLTVRTSPPATQVVVDGQNAGQTPLPAPIVLAPGVYDVEARRPGYLPSKRTVKLGDGASGELDLELEEDPSSPRASLGLTISEPSPLVLVDGRAQRSSSPLRLPPGLHRVRVEHAGFLPLEREVDLPDGGRMQLELDLVPTAETRAEHDRSVATRRTTSLVVIVAGAALAAAGATYWALNASSVDEANRLLDRRLFESEIGSKRRCDTSNGASREVCSAELTVAEDEKNAAELRSSLAIATASVGALAVAVGLVLRFTGPDPKKYENRTALVPTVNVADRGGNVGLSGAF